MVEKRGRKATVVPFVDGGPTVTETALTPVEATAPVPMPEQTQPVETFAAETAATFEAAAEAVETFQAAAEIPVAETAAAEVVAELPEPSPASVEAAAPAVQEIATTTASTLRETPMLPVTAAPFLKGLLKMATAPENTYVATERFQAMFGDVNERAKSAVEKTTKLAEELTELTKGNVEAFVASGRVAAKGAEAITQEAAEFSKKSFENATGAFKSFAAVKSPTELFQLQSEFAKTSFDTAVAEASKFSESMLKLMGEIAQPLSSRYAVAAEKFKSTTSF